MRYVSAGHDAACIVARNGRRFLDATGPILGLMDDDRSFREETVDLAPGDIVGAVTDGFTEARNEQLEFLGTEALATIIERNRERPAAELAAAVALQAYEYAGPRLRDDVAALILKVT
jgi:serine phosphatase RsbU (regulator of sigma subunit)